MATISMEPGMPESFNVLLKEIRSLGINIELRRRRVNPHGIPPWLEGGNVSLFKKEGVGELPNLSEKTILVTQS